MNFKVPYQINLSWKIKTTLKCYEGMKKWTVRPFIFGVADYK